MDGIGYALQCAPAFQCQCPMLLSGRISCTCLQCLPIKVSTASPTRNFTALPLLCITLNTNQRKNGGGLGAIQARLIMGFELNKLLSMDFTIYRNDRTGNNARLVPRPLPDLDFIAQLCMEKNAR